MIINLEFNNTREEIELIYLYNLYKKGRPIYKISRKL
jgi:hypothetical protein